MKTLITHVRPHLDDICGIWLLSRYLPEYADAKVTFVVTNANGGSPVDGSDVTCVGVGRGMFDEHKGDIGKCATTLVWDKVKMLAMIDETERRAVERLVQWVLLEDTGRLTTVQLREFTVPQILQGEFDRSGRDSGKALELGFRILDALRESGKELVLLEDAWNGRIAFTSRFGPAVALVTSARDFEKYAYGQGFDLAISASPDGSYHTIRAKAESQIDLTPVHEELRRREPKAGWFFHHSKKMLICGGDHAPDVVPSGLVLQELIDIVK